MKRFFKRFLAYIVDIAIISLVVTLLTANNKINFQYNKYADLNTKYNEVYEEYNEVLNKQTKLEKKYKEDKITKKEYNKTLKKYESISKKYQKELKVLTHKIQKNSVIYYIIYCAFVLGYFGIFQYSFNGQTLGKRILRLKIVNNKEGELRIWQTLLRTFILYNIWIYILIVSLAYILNSKDYYTPYIILNNISSTIQLLIGLMVIMNVNGRGLHDYIARTKVLEFDKEGNEIVYKNPYKEEIEEAEIISEKEVENKKTDKSKKRDKGDK